MKLPRFELYERQRTGKLLFILCSGIAVVIFLLLSNNLIKELSQQERERMNIWADATQRLANADANADFEFLLSIISQNNSIPVLVADSAFNILDSRNFSLPEQTEAEPGGFTALTPKNKEYLQSKLKKATGGRSLAQLVKENPHFIEVDAGHGSHQYIYYEDSLTLRRLGYFPYIQLGVMILIAIILYFAVIYLKRAEQNRVWVGLSKETAHQLGTPISSLMAWTQFLEASGTDEEVTTEIDKDVKRLGVIAERFSKIGSRPELELEYINEATSTSLDYMRNRISGKVELQMFLEPDDHGVMISRSLFAWVMENLTKNAVDAMEGQGRIEIRTGSGSDKVWIEVKDNGKGIPRKLHKTVFNPGYTTKRRGWGLGLTLVKRIIEDYHGGRIFVKESEPGVGTTFRIELPKVKED